MARSVSLILLLTVASALAAPKSLPSTWPTCKKSDPNIGTCLQNAIQSVVPHLSEKGVKELGVFPIDPLVVTTIDMVPGKGPVSIELHFSDLEITGFSKAKIGLVKADVDKYVFSAPLFFKQGVTLKGHYKIDGKVLVLPITGEGPCELFLDDIDATVNLIGKELVKDGVTYMEVENFKFDFKPKRLNIKLENLFNGNKQLSDNMNVFLNENWAEVLKELKPAVTEAFGQAFGEITNRIFKKVPYNQIFT
ncbi:Protein takeout [Frankliniella fusca]|uniref:Protein takeout n=1 Tax=Frankliniella fusca TaxID=407009 RepID=A0AAE1GSV1_9NEOP|nr:Protein takeout [Frankliniella fusca]